MRGKCNLLPLFTSIMCTFARAAGAHDGHKLAFTDVKVYSFEDMKGLHALIGLMNTG